MMFQFVDLNNPGLPKPNSALIFCSHVKIVDGEAVKIFILVLKFSRNVPPVQYCQFF